MSKTLYITANSRLSMSLKQQMFLSTAQTAVAETPAVMTLSQWWEQWYETALLNADLVLDDLPEKVLGAFEAQMLLEQCLQDALQTEDDELQEGSALLNWNATLKQLYQARQLEAEWLQESWRQEVFLSQESRLFIRVVDAYKAMLAERGWMDESMLQERRLIWLEQGVGSVPKVVHLRGFDEIVPFMQRWIGALRQRGVEVVAETVSESLAVDRSYFPAQHSREESARAVNWALQTWRDLQQYKPSAQIKIALVAPDLNDYKALLQQQLDEQLYVATDSLLASQNPDAVKPYNISLGEALFDIPLVQQAWLSLQLFLQPHKPVSFQDWSHWLTSPYNSATLESRHQADLEIRRLQWSQFHWPHLLDVLQKGASEEEGRFNPLPKSLVKSLTVLADRPKSESLSLDGFIAAVRFCLDTLQWPGSRTLSSREFQQKSAFENALQMFASLHLTGQYPLSRWMGILGRYLREQIHQPQTVGHAPIQIMGMLEAGGQAFDALWILGLHHEAWPRAANPNPFLPMRLQHEFKLPRCDAQRELNYAQTLSMRLLGSCREVVFSYPQWQGDAQLLPSPLLKNWQPFESLPGLDSSSLGILNRRHRLGSVEWVEDNRGCQLAEGALAPGGSGILQAQSQCPLMAYIDYRLGAKYGLLDVEENLGQTNQGILLHRVMELFWQETGDLHGLLSLSEEALQQRLQELIAEVFAEFQDTQSAVLLELEQARILQLCQAWLEIEKTRNAFKVVQTEARHELELGGLKFKVVVDRVDESEGRAIIIDYKTGRASIKGLLQDEIQAPQLAVYLFAVPDDLPVAAIGYALLHSDDGVKLSALTEDDSVLPTSRSITLFSRLAEKEDGEFFDVRWEDFLQSLRNQVEDLAVGIRQGDARLRFRKLSDMDYAAGRLALRLPEALAQLEAYENGEDEA
ncbi:PD-(D/E)XK nuclease family protein [Thiomicrorhabdus heinhorstiae]|uniref:PD-(D/E)XK nuclease family protein n=1 Tax=Thiomicrorhabdus heinhorstiae TaxID=2748010 RepID=A0ABS0BZY9_9GAMM|nr:PD-(D/E)XK nuclease family protein [Thiomicrorhabdus heinhorstiae]MBF6058401.1 PD-(D/E)XK nuclease family protein [Thiomicrorhabdus heinhorstiae]